MIEHLQINDVAPCVHYDADGVQAAFTFPFAVFKAADLEVWQDRVRVSGSFSVSGVGISSGGAVLFTVPPAAGTRVTLRRRMALERVSDFQTDGIIRAKTLNDELDYQVAAVQQVADDVARCLQRPFTSGSTADLALPDPVAGRALKWNDAGDGLVNSDGDPDAVMTVGAAAAVSAAAAAAAATAADGHRAVAQVCADSAADSAAVAAALVGAVALPDAAGHGLAYLRQNATEDGLEYRTPAQVLADLGGQSAADVQAQIAKLDASMQNVRDEGVLTALRQMLNTSVGTGALVRGKQWELSTDEWGATSTGESHVSGTVGYYVNSPGGYTNDIVSVMTSNTAPSGVASASAEPQGALAYLAFQDTLTNGWFTNASSGWLAYEFAAPRVVAAYTVTAPNPSWDAYAPSDAPKNWTFEGWTGSGWVVLDTRSGITWTSDQKRTFAIASPGAYAKYRLNVSASDHGSRTSVNELEMFEALTPYPMLLAVPAAVTINSAPACADLFFLWKDDSGTALTAPSGTIRLSRDGGVTKAMATLTVVAAFDNTYSIIRARADVSGQPIGTSLWADIDFGTVKQRFAAPALLGE